jgi:hypothetical protein
MAKNAKLDITAVDFYANLHNHRYKFPKQHERILQRMFVTAASHLEQKEIRVTIVGKNKYREAIRGCRLKGIRLESVKVNEWAYEYRAVIRPKILLRQANRFGKKVAGEHSLAASNKLHFER